MNSFTRNISCEDYRKNPNTFYYKMIGAMKEYTHGVDYTSLKAIIVNERFRNHKYAPLQIRIYVIVISPQLIIEHFHEIGNEDILQFLDAENLDDKNDDKNTYSRCGVIDLNQDEKKDFYKILRQADFSKRTKYYSSASNPFYRGITFIDTKGCYDVLNWTNDGIDNGISEDIVDSEILEALLQKIIKRANYQLIGGNKYKTICEKRNIEEPQYGWLRKKINNKIEQKIHKIELRRMRRLIKKYGVYIEEYSIYY